MLDPLQWLAEHEGAEVELLPVDECGRLDVDGAARRRRADPASVALVSVMWANNEVGTVQPVARGGRRSRTSTASRCTPTPCRRSAQVPVDFAGMRRRRDDRSPAHKVGGPYGVGALVVRRELAARPPLLHGGGQERDIRSGTIDPPAIAGFAAAVRAGRQAAARAREPARPRCATSWCAGCARWCPTRCSTATRRSDRRLPGNAHLSFPGCEGDSLLMLLDARGIECSTGSACSAGVPAGLATCCWPWAARRARPRASLRFSLGHTTHRADVDALVAAIGPVVERGRAAGAARGSRRAEAAECASSPRCPGGVDSAVAAARAVEAGHDVTGIHLALSRNPQSYRTGARGCCTIEDSNDARRAADVIGIPFYVWDLSERFHEDVVEDFLAEYAAGRTPNPCLRCNEKIKFAAVLDRALGPRASTRSPPATTPGCAPGADGTIELHRAVDPAKDQSYVLGVLDPGPAARTRCSRWATPPRPRCARRPSAEGCGGAQKPDSHDICFIPDGDTAGWLREKLARSAPRGTSSTTPPARCWGAHEGAYGFTIGQRRGLRIGTPAPDGEPATSWTSSRSAARSRSARARS